MSRGSEPTIYCDADGCTQWWVDYYEANAAYVGGVRISPIERAPGWHCTDTADYCPEHA